MSIAGPASKPVRARAGAAIAAMAGFAFLLRAYNLLALPIFTDEAIYLQWAADIWTRRTMAGLLIPIADDGKQPLFMWMAGAAMQLLDDPLLAGRAVSAIVGVAGTLGVYLAGRLLGGSAVGLVAALFYAVAPFTLLFDRMALADGLLNSIAVWALCIGVFLATRIRSRRNAVLMGLALGLTLAAALWTKLPGALLLLFPLLCVLLLRKPREMAVPALGLAVGYSLCALVAAPLALVPHAENQLAMSAKHTYSISDLTSFPVEVWRSNALEYWTWVQLYLPAPLYWLVLGAVPWGLRFRPRLTLLLVGCWAAFALPATLMGRFLYTSRYVVPSVFPLLLLSAALASWTWERASRFLARSPLSKGPSSLVAPFAASVFLLIVLGPSLAFDTRLLMAPSSAKLAETDSWQYVVGWPSGYGFNEAVSLVKKRASEYGQQPVIVLSDHFHGLPHDGLKLYLKGIPNVHYYVDGHIPWGGEGLLAAWRPHQVPLLIVTNDGRNDLTSFEKNVPEAELIGAFWKPGGEFSFRVYEIQVARLGAPGQ